MLKNESTGKQSSPPVIGHRKTTKLIQARQSRPTKCMFFSPEKRLDSQGCQSDPPTTKTTLTLSSTGMPVLCVRSQEANRRPVRVEGGRRFPGPASPVTRLPVRQTIRETPPQSWLSSPHRLRPPACASPAPLPRRRSSARGCRAR